MENSRSSFADWRERRRELTPTQQKLAERIRTAFDGVSCGDSLGYMSGFAEDDYCEKDIINAFMQREQRTYWPAITPDWLFGLNATSSNPPATVNPLSWRHPRNNPRIRTSPIAPAGIEPTSKVPETFVLSIERRSRGAEGIMPQAAAACQARSVTAVGFRLLLFGGGGCMGLSCLPGFHAGYG